MNVYIATATVSIKDCSKYQIGKSCALERCSHLRNLIEVACHLNIQLIVITIDQWTEDLSQSREHLMRFHQYLRKLGPIVVAIVIFTGKYF